MIHFEKYRTYRGTVTKPSMLVCIPLFSRINHLSVSVKGTLEQAQKKKETSGQLIVLEKVFFPCVTDDPQKYGAVTENNIVYLNM